MDEPKKKNAFNLHHPAFRAVIAAAVALLVLAACFPASPRADDVMKWEQTPRLPQPDFPLTEDAVTDALARAGLPGVISQEETYSGGEGHIAYSLRDPIKTYSDTENKLLLVGISSAMTEGERFLSAFFFSDEFEPGTYPFAWADWKKQIVFTTLLYGGFTDEEALYRALCAQTAQADATRWELIFPGAYCRARYTLQDTRKISSSLGNTILGQRGVLTINVYGSEALYQRMMREAQANKKAMEDSRAKAKD